MNSSLQSEALMKAIMLESYGGPEVLRLQEVARPALRDDAVRVKIHAASINPYDRYLMYGRPYLARLESGVKFPKAKGLGQDFAGVVEAVGEKVTQFKVGDKVFGDVAERFENIDRSFAEYACVEADFLVHKPDTISYEQAAAVPLAARTALRAIREHCQGEPGMKVLINGASGGVGSFAVQLAKYFGAEVTAVCSYRHLDKMTEIGADHLVDYTQEDFTRHKAQYDLMLDIVSSKPWSQCQPVLKPGGTYVWVGSPELSPLFGPLIPGFKVFFRSKFTWKNKMVMAVTPQVKEDLLFLADLLSQKKLTPLIDRTYPLEQLPDAIQYWEQGHVSGKIVIKIR